MNNLINYVTTIVIATLITGSANAAVTPFSENNLQWQPQYSETLITLPANVIEKKVAQDFSQSPVAKRIQYLNTEMADKVSFITSMQENQKQVPQEKQSDHAFELLQHKSNYLDLLQESHSLHQQTLLTKQKFYKNILNKLQEKQGNEQSGEVYQLKQVQSAARLRMEKVMEQVDQSLLGSSSGESTKYGGQYSQNLAQIDQLKSAIAKHSALAAPEMDGVEMNSQEYVRQLMMQGASEQSLLDQEALMLSYMAKLVALDAQALEVELVESSTENILTQQTLKPSNVSRLFY